MAKRKGGKYSDYIFGTPEADEIEAGSGDDYVFADDGNDTIVGGDGCDLIYAGAGDDIVFGGMDTDVIEGGEGDDTLYGGAGFDILTGGRGDDTLTGGGGADLFVYAPGDGNDTIVDFVAGEDRIDLSKFAGIANANIVARQEGVNVVLEFSWTNGNSGGSITLLNFSIAELDSVEFVTADAEHTLTVTIVDDDPPVVDPPDPVLPTGESQEGSTQPVDTDGDEGEDAATPATVRGTMAAETLSGAEGADKIICQNGDDTAHGRGGDDRLWGGGGDDVLRGNAGDDRLHGGKGNDALYGGKGNDYLNGGKDADTLYGGKGNDRLEGLTGYDLLYGGAGADRFVYGHRLFGHDRIGDFEDGKDLLDFTGSGLQWGNLSVSNNRDGDAVVRVKGADSRIVLEGVDASLIGQDDFLFS